MIKSKLEVPNKMAEVTLGQYQKFSKLLKKDSDPDFVNKKMVEIFCGIPLKEVDKIKYESLLKIIEVLSKIFKETPNLEEKFEMNGIKYGFHPQISEMTFGEFVDLDTFAGDWNTMHKALGILYRPITDEFRGSYLIEEYDGTKETYMDKMPLDIAMGAIFFLSNLRSELMSATLNYSKKELKRNISQVNKFSGKSGGGILRSFHYLEAMLQNMKK